MASPPASDPPSPSISRSDDSILSGGGGSGSTKEEGGTSRGGAAAALGGKRENLANVRGGNSCGDADRSSSFTATTAAASTSGREDGGSRQSVCTIAAATDAAASSSGTSAATAKTATAKRRRKSSSGGNGSGSGGITTTRSSSNGSGSGGVTTTRSSSNRSGSLQGEEQLMVGEAALDENEGGREACARPALSPLFASDNDAAGTLCAPDPLGLEDDASIASFDPSSMPFEPPSASSLCAYGNNRFAPLAVHDDSLKDVPTEEAFPLVSTMGVEESGDEKRKKRKGKGKGNRSIDKGAVSSSKHWGYAFIWKLLLVVFMLAELRLGYNLVESAGSTMVHWSSLLARTVFEAPFAGSAAPDSTKLSELGDSMHGDGPDVSAGVFAFDADFPSDGESGHPVYECEFTCPICEVELTCLVYDGKATCPIYDGQQDGGGDRVGRECVGPPPRIFHYWVSTYFDLEEARRNGTRSPVEHSDPNSWTHRLSSWLFCFASTLIRFYRWYCDVLDCMLLGLPLAWLFGSVSSFVTFAGGIHWCLERVFGHDGPNLSTGKKKKSKKDGNDFSWNSIARTMVGSIYFMWTAMRVLDRAGVSACVIIGASTRVPVPNSCPIALLLYSGLAVIFRADFLDFCWVAKWAQITLLFGFAISINAAMILLHVDIFAACLSFDALRALQESLYVSIVTIHLVFAIQNLWKAAQNIFVYQS